MQRVAADGRGTRRPVAPCRRGADAEAEALSGPVARPAVNATAIRTGTSQARDGRMDPPFVFRTAQHRRLLRRAALTDANEQGSPAPERDLVAGAPREHGGLERWGLGRRPVGLLEPHSERHPVLLSGTGRRTELIAWSEPFRHGVGSCNRATRRSCPSRPVRSCAWTTGRRAPSRSPNGRPLRENNWTSLSAPSL